MKDLEIIKSRKQYNKLLREFESLLDAPSKSKEGKRAEILALLIEDYENKHFSIPDPDPIEAIKYMMTENSMSYSELASLLGDRGNVSKVLNRKRKLTLDMIRKIHKYLHIPTELLIQDYSLQS